MKVSKGASSEFTVHSLSLPHLFFFNRFIYLLAFFLKTKRFILKILSSFFLEVEELA